MFIFFRLINIKNIFVNFKSKERNCLYFLIANGTKLYSNLSHTYGAPQFFFWCFGWHLLIFPCHRNRLCVLPYMHPQLCHQFTHMDSTNLSEASSAQNGIVWSFLLINNKLSVHVLLNLIKVIKNRKLCLSLFWHLTNSKDISIFI